MSRNRLRRSDVLSSESETRGKEQRWDPRDGIDSSPLASSSEVRRRSPQELRQQRRLARSRSIGLRARARSARRSASQSQSKRTKVSILRQWWEEAWQSTKVRLKAATQTLNRTAIRDKILSRTQVLALILLTILLAFSIPLILPLSRTGCTILDALHQRTTPCNRNYNLASNISPLLLHDDPYGLNTILSYNITETSSREAQDILEKLHIEMLYNLTTASEHWEKPLDSGRINPQIEIVMPNAKLIQKSIKDWDEAVHVAQNKAMSLGIKHWMYLTSQQREAEMLSWQIDFSLQKRYRSAFGYRIRNLFYATILGIPKYTPRCKVHEVFLWHTKWQLRELSELIPETEEMLSVVQALQQTQSVMITAIRESWNLWTEKCISQDSERASWTLPVMHDFELPRRKLPACCWEWQAERMRLYLQEDSMVALKEHFREQLHFLQELKGVHAEVRESLRRWGDAWGVVRSVEFEEFQRSFAALRDEIGEKAEELGRQQGLG